MHHNRQQPVSTFDDWTLTGRTQSTCTATMMFMLQQQVHKDQCDGSHRNRIDLYYIMEYEIYPVDPVTVEIIFYGIIGYEMVSIGHFVDLYECKLELYFEFELENVNVKCEFDWYDNGYDHYLSLPAVNFDNIGIGIPRNNIVECVFNGIGFNCNVDSENFYDNRNDCGILSPPISSPHAAVFIFNGTGILMAGSIVLECIFGVNLCKYGFVNEINTQINNEMNDYISVLYNLCKIITIWCVMNRIRSNSGTANDRKNRNWNNGLILLHTFNEMAHVINILIKISLLASILDKLLIICDAINTNFSKISELVGINGNSSNLSDICETSYGLGMGLFLSGIHLLCKLWMNQY